MEDIKGKRMNDNDPSMLNEFGAWVTASWVVGITILSAFIRYYKQVDRRKAKHSFFRFLGEFAICSLMSLVTFALCDYAGLDWHYTIVAIGYSTFKGTSALLKLESIYNAIKKEM